MMRYILYFFFGCLAVAFIGCNHGNKPQAASVHKAVEQDTAAEDFHTFITRFHQHRFFHASRVLHKVIGFNSDDYDIENDDTTLVYRWRRADLPFYLDAMNEALNNPQYERSTEMNDTIAKELLGIPNSDCLFNAIFRRIKGKWYLSELIVNMM